MKLPQWVGEALHGS